MILGFIWSLIQMGLEVECMLQQGQVSYLRLNCDGYRCLGGSDTNSVYLGYQLYRHAMQHQGKLRCYCQGRWAAASLQVTARVWVWQFLFVQFPAG